MFTRRVCETTRGSGSVGLMTAWLTLCLMLSAVALSEPTAALSTAHVGRTALAEQSNDRGLPAIDIDVPGLFADASDQVGHVISGCPVCLDSPSETATTVYGRAVIAGVDSLITAPDIADLGALFSFLFGSGYFGGLYLKAGLSGTATALHDPIARFARAVGATTAEALEDGVRSLGATAVAGSDGEVLASAGLWLPALSAIGGYNNGYVAVALANPPTHGGDSTDTRLLCHGTFRCTTPTFPMAADGTLEPGRQLLLTGSDPLASDLRRVTVDVEAATFDAGSAVWTAILSGQTFNASAYATIIELSIGFLKVVHASILAITTGILTGNTNLVRRGLLSTAALVTWAGSYFVGLASPQSTVGVPGLPATP